MQKRNVSFPQSCITNKDRLNLGLLGLGSTLPSFPLHLLRSGTLHMLLAKAAVICTLASPAKSRTSGPFPPLGATRLLPPT